MHVSSEFDCGWMRSKTYTIPTPYWFVRDPSHLHMTQITSHASKDIASVGVVTQKRLFLKTYYFSITGSFIKWVLSLRPPQIKLQ